MGLFTSFTCIYLNTGSACFYQIKFFLRISKQKKIVSDAHSVGETDLFLLSYSSDTQKRHVTAGLMNI